MRVMSKYYTRIRMCRMAELLDLTEDVSIYSTCLSCYDSLSEVMNCLYVCVCV